MHTTSVHALQVVGSSEDVVSVATGMELPWATSPLGTAGKAQGQFGAERGCNRDYAGISKSGL
jgi:hypothetical protein